MSPARNISPGHASTGLVTMTVPQWKRHECSVGDLAVKMMPKQAELVAALLVSHPDRLVGQSTLIEALWPEYDSEPEYAAKLLGKLIFFIRRLGITIENRHGFGWRIPRHARSAEQEPMRLAA